jgi:hypothetical protein
MRTEQPAVLAHIRASLWELRRREVPFQWPDWWSETLAPSTERYDGLPDDRSTPEIIVALQCLLGAVETKFRDALYEGKLVCWGRPGSSLAKYERAPAWAVIAIESWWKGGGILRLESGELFYAARVEPTETDKRETNRGGRPPLPYKASVMAYIFDWLDQEGERPIPEIKAAMVEFIAKIDDQGGPSDSTLKTWANEALAEYRRRCEAGLR